MLGADSTKEWSLRKNEASGMTSTVIRTQRFANATGECYTFSLHQRLQHIAEPQMFWVALSVIPGMGEFVCLPSQGNS